MSARLAALALITLSFAFSGTGYSQTPSPLCVTGCGGGGSAIVYVTPDGQGIQGIAGFARTVPYIVHNIGTVSDTYTLTCSVVGGNETCGTVLPTSVTLAPESTATVNVTFTPGSVGTAGTVQLEAVGNYCNGGGGQAPTHRPLEPQFCTYATDSGTYNVTNVGGFAPTAVALRNQNGDNQDRSLCLLSSAGEAGAWECGDLIVTHGLPGYATMGHERSLTLLYNSATAAPHPVVAVAVTESDSSWKAPSSVFAKILINGVVRDSASYNAWGGTGPLTRQIALTYDASGDSTGIYPFTLLVQNRYSGGVYPDTVTGNILVVNRSQSQLGAGWALEGVERLYLSQSCTASSNPILWVGGDGSAKAYSSLGGNKWLAPAGEYRDTIYYNTGTSTYTDTLRHKIAVTFDVCGRHIKTANRVGQSSTFHWNSSGQLDTIGVPPTGATGTKYVLAYTSGKLSQVTDPGSRALGVTISSDRLTSIKDPDSLTTSFTYDANGRMLSRTTRRGFTTHYAFAHGLRLTTDSVMVDTAGATTHTYAISAFRPWDEQGLAIAVSGDTAVDTTAVYTKIDGPRTDVVDTAEFWVDRWGAPVKTQDPMGAVSAIVRGNANVPALITQVTQPSGRIVTLTYDNLGNLTQQRDSTLQLGTAGLQTRVTRWTYFADSTKFSPDSEVDSASTGALVTRFVYNRWGLLRDVTAPNGHVTHFDFLTTGSDSGLVRAVTELQVPAWDTASKSNPDSDRRTAFAFDNLGNVTSDTSPMRHVTRYNRDGLERVTDVYDPANHHTMRVYDALNRVTQSKVDTGTSSYLVTTYHYNIDVMDSVSDPRGVYRAFRYDAANRRTKVIDDYGKADVSYLDPAGLVDSVQNRIGVVIRMNYDADGRQTRRVWGSHREVPGDSIISTYDVMGRLLSATDSGRKETFTYFGVGQVSKDVQSRVDGSKPTTLTYAYDRLGRRIYYINGIPGNLVHSDSIWYSYNWVGDLATVGMRWRDHQNNPTSDSVQFQNDTVGRRVKLTYLHGIVEHFAYDGDGHLRLICAQQNPLNQHAPDHVFNFTEYYSVVDSDGLVRRTTHNNTGLTSFGCGVPNQVPGDETASYDARHELRTQAVGGDSMIYRYDGSGNRTMDSTMTRGGSLVFAQAENMSAGHNRLRMYQYLSNPHDSMWVGYFDDGSRGETMQFLHDTADQYAVGSRFYFTDALGRMSGTAENVCEPEVGGGGCLFQWENNATVCRYDALGRLQYACENTSNSMSYDGSNVVRIGNDSSIGTGGNMTIVHGPGTDDPLIEHNDWLSEGPYGYYAYLLTDGQGRQLAVGDTGSTNLSSDPGYAYAINGGKYAGGITNATNYAATRDSNYQEIGLSYFRNRFYDQATGRWIQEDPAGLAGGINLYEYVGNNPAGFTDPFGLCPGISGTNQENLNDCTKGSPEWYAARDVKGEGSHILNVAGGLLSSLARAASEHVVFNVQAGPKVFSGDMNGVFGNGEHQSSTNINIPAAGASVSLVLGSTNVDKSVDIGLSKHLGISVNYGPDNSINGISLNLGGSTEQSPIGATVSDASKDPLDQPMPTGNHLNRPTISSRHN